MARPLRVHIPGALYHVMSRGNAKQQIFVGDRDHEYFLERLAMTTGRFGIACRAYCLMWNHFHLLLEVGALPISRMMQQLNSKYSQWFNRHHDRVGHVLQGRFKARVVDREGSAMQVVRYIVLNPVAAGLVSDPVEWRWSSYRATIGVERAPDWLDVDWTVRLFDADVERARRLFADFIDAGFGPKVRWSRRFAAQVWPALEPSRRNREFVREEKFSGRPSLEELFAAGAESWRQQVMFEAFQRYGYTLRELGAFINRHPSTVWRQIRQFDAKIKI